MKIVVSSTGSSMEDIFDMRFGRCSKFIVYDTETEEIEVVENEGPKANSGAGIKAAQQVVDINPEVVITGSLGPNAFTALSNTSIKTYKGKQKESIKRIIEMMIGNELELIKSAGAKNAGKA